MNLNELRDKAYKTACDHGFHDKELSNEHWLCLVVSELSEAVEADRKGKKPQMGQFECGMTYPKIDFEKEYEYHIKGSVDEELADAFIRLLDLYGLRGIDLNEDAFDEETIKEYAVTYKLKSFTESIFHIIRFICENSGSLATSSALPEMYLLEILGFAKHLGIYLMWHIEMKMKYNRSTMYSLRIWTAKDERKKI